ncbi:MAG TPA: PLP-dependent aminotransferase family protein [Steroidobacteraceae bacterium]|nr:PLP-dependent aminotransferase family protein [Steroidobacteraceae bacterium]
MVHSRARRIQAVKPFFEIKLNLKPAGSRESSRTLHGELKAAILDGRLAAGVKLPATRRSSDVFGVSRNTAAEVYERLVTEGHAVTRHGAGTFVVEKSPARAAAARPIAEQPLRHRLNGFWLRPEVTAAMSFWHDSPEPSLSTRKGAPIDFRPAMVDSRLFPLDVFRRVSAKQLRGLERKPASYKSPQGNQGNFHLRKAIVKHIAITRAVACQAEEILVTSGAQQAFDLLARALVTPNETIVALEDPGYPPMRVAFAAAGARLVPIGIDEEGLMVEQLPPGVRIICVTPSHQFPLGISMSMRRREALIEFARKHGAVIIEDDYDGEFRYEGSPLAALRAAEAADVVFYVGTFSKCMLSALRLGFIVAPEWAIGTLTAAKNCLDWHCAVPIQSAVAAFISEGHLARHVGKMREIYRARRQLLLNTLRETLSEWLAPIPSLYGMHISAMARDGVDLEAVTGALARHHVKMHTLSRYFLGAKTKAGLVLGYGTVDLAEIRRGMSTLSAILRN